MLAVFSAPVWLVLVTQRLLDDESDPTPSYAPNQGQFDPIFVIMLVIFTAVAGAALGALFAVVAHLRDEPAYPVRAIAFIANLAFVVCGLYQLAPFRSP